MKLRYTPIRKIADGDTAEIFLATQHGAEGFEKRVILKRILPSLYADKQFRKLLVDEAHIAAGLNHSSIVQVLDLGEADGRYFLAMELVDGWTLERVLRRAQAAGVPFPPALALYVTAEVCRALAYAHAHTASDGSRLDIVHGDVCPDNVLLSAQGEVKLTDFGLAKAHSRRTQVTGILKPANAAYMSPEQASGQPIDARSDLFSAGSMLYTMIAGSPAFAVDDAQALTLLREARFAASETLRPELSPEIHQLIRRAMSLSPAERFARADDMLVDVERVMRIALRPVGQTELMRWLSQLSDKDGIPPLTRDTAAVAPASPAPSPAAPLPPMPPPPPPAASSPAGPPATPPAVAGRVIGGPALPPPPPGVVPQPRLPVPTAGAAPEQAMDDSGTLELDESEMEASTPPPLPAAAHADATIVTTTPVPTTPVPTTPAEVSDEKLPPGPTDTGEPPVFNIPKAGAVANPEMKQGRWRSKLVWLGGAAALVAVGLAAKVMLTSSPSVDQVLAGATDAAALPSPPPAPESPPVPAPAPPSEPPTPAAAPPPTAEPAPGAEPPPAAPREPSTEPKTQPSTEPTAEPTTAQQAKPEATPVAHAKTSSAPARSAESASSEPAPPSPRRVDTKSPPSPPARENPAAVSLVVKCAPAGCQVASGKHALGSAPVSMTPKPGTTHHFTFTKSGYTTVHKSFTVSARKKQTVEVTLKKEPAKPAPAPAAAPPPPPRKDRKWWEIGR